VNDDWRVELEVGEGGGAQKLLDDVREIEVADQARGALGDRVIVSHEGDKLFAYAATAEEAREAERVLRERLAEHGLGATGELRRWHPEEERWEPADVPLPVTPAERAAEHERVQEREREESEELGLDQWEVRAELPSHRETVELAARLEAEGMAVVRRWRFLVVGAETEDDAQALADRVRAEAPMGTRVVAEGSQAAAWAQLHPCSVLGGLGT
jgi:hypothetical protein